jgi:hypothetical protein
MASHTGVKIITSIFTSACDAMIVSKDVSLRQYLTIVFQIEKE